MKIRNYRGNPSGFCCVLAIMAFMVLGCGRFLGSKGETSGTDYKKIVASLPTYDPNAPPVSPGAAALRMLAELDPKVTQLIDGVEAVERAAVARILGERDAQFKDSNAPNISSADHQLLRIPAARSARTPAPATALFLLQGGQTNSPVGGNHDAGLVAILISGMSDVLVPYLKETGSINKPGVTETIGDTTTTMSVEIGRNEDGSTKFGVGMKTETTKNGVGATSEMTAKIEGQRCPNPDGQLPFTIQVRLSAEAGGVSVTRDVTAMVRAVVGDDANVTGKTMDLSQATRQNKNGQQVYIETAKTLTAAGEEYTESNFRIVRNSQQATAENAGPLSEEGLDAALTVALTALRNAELVWLDGGCTQIEATSPGSVVTNSTTSIPVTVRHKFDGTEVPSKLDVTLKGERSVDPMSIARTAGRLTYHAPAEKNKTATIGLTATSRRGRSTLDLAASTGGQSYLAAGVSNSVSFTGEICSLDKPFVLNGTFGNGSETQSFTPSSSTGGAVKESGNSGGCTQVGEGTYEVTLNDQGSGELRWTEKVTASCPPYSTTKTYTFSVPVKPAPGLSCP